MQTHVTPSGGIRHHFVSALAYHPHAANAKDKLWPVPAAEALLKRYISPDRPHEIMWVKFDMDDSGHGDHTAARWIDAGLPQPHIIVTNRHNRGSHYLYGLTTGLIRGPRGRLRPRMLYTTVSTGMARMLGADRAYTGSSVKNPFHRDWHTLWHEAPLYELNALLKELPAPMRRNVPRGEALGEGRNVDLFTVTRLWAYDALPAAYRAGSFDRWQAAVLEEATGNNCYTPRLPAKEVLSVAGSIARWTWARADSFTEGGDERPPLKRSQMYSWNRPELSREEARARMSEGGSRGVEITNAKRKANTHDAITGAIGELAMRGVLNPSVAQIASLSGVSESSVARFRRSATQGQGMN